jgi:hypothetical protein
MEISPACLPPAQPPIAAEDRTHPLFATYMAHRSWFSANLLEAPAFADWLYHREINELHEEASAHPRYAEFLGWMRSAKGGRRTCPTGVFPHNFHFWLAGGRW